MCPGCDAPSVKKPRRVSPIRLIICEAPITLETLSSNRGKESSTTDYDLSSLGNEVETFLCAVSGFYKQSQVL